MGTGYTRNDTANNIADGNVINASDLDGEFDAVQAAFNASTGHSHDGTTGEGPQIQTAGLADDAVTGAKIDSTTTITAAGFTGPLTGNVSGNVTGNASTATALQTARTIAGQSFDGTANISIAPTDLTGVTSTAAELNILDGVTSTAAELNLVDGSAAGTVVNSKVPVYSAAGALNATSLQVGGVAITATPAELNTLDGITATTAELNYTDGVTSNIQTQLDAKQASGDYVTATGDTMTGALNFGDNVKAQFGAGNDLQVYHDGSSAGAIINSTGDLIISGNATDDVRLTAKLTEESIVLTPNGAVDLYYDNAKKLATTSTGVTVTGTVVADGLSLGDSEKAIFGASNDLQIYHDGSASYIDDAGTGSLAVRTNGNGLYVQNYDSSETMAKFINDADVTLYYDNSAKFATTTNGVSVTGVAVGTLTTDNDLSFDMNASNQFKCTPTANGTLTFTNITAGQSGNIFLVNSGGYTISAASTTYISSADLTAISSAGSYFLSYFSDGTNVMVSASAAVTSAGA